MTPLEKTVAISVSAPAETDLAARGLSLDHVQHAYVEVARQLLAAGASIAYGGDPRASTPNYVFILLALLRTYSRSDRPSRDRIQLYLAAPIWTEMTASERARMRVLTTLNEVPGTGEKSEPGSDFTAMRESMTAGTDARVVIGGRLDGRFAGRWPGIVEEAFLTLRAGCPLYVAGGLGGAASFVADMMRGRDGAGGELADRDVLGEAFEGVVLANGLTPEENDLLFDTVDLDVLVALVLRGMERQRG